MVLKIENMVLKIDTNECRSGEKSFGRGKTTNTINWENPIGQPIIKAE